MNKYFNKIILLSFFALCFNLLKAQIKLPALVSDSMILQRDKSVTIWGWSMGGDKVSVKFNGANYAAIPDANKRWEVKLPATKAGGPYEMVISAGKYSSIIKEILFGDVWLCSGQSNMGFAMQDLAFKYPDDLKNSENNFIREFLVGRQISFEPKETTSGQWKRSCPANIGRFSAVAHYMAKNLYDKYHVPIGTINSSWGGTPAESWTSEEGLKGFDDLLGKYNQLRVKSYLDSLVNNEKKIGDDWNKKAREQDLGYKGGAANWSKADIDLSDWKTMKLPGYWENYGAKNVDGVVWARKEIVLTKEMLGKDAKLFLGMIDDADTTYFNGVKIGFNTQKHALRQYKVAANLLKEGVNVITVRIVDNDNVGGFEPQRKYGLNVGNKEIDISGEWKYKIGISMPPLQFDIYNKVQMTPTTLYNGMIAPFTNYTIKGAAWYQGEANSARGAQYRRLLPALIEDWRKQFNQGDFPFLVVQLPNFMAAKELPSESNWAELRDAQLYTSQKVTNCAIAITIDIGDASNIHPYNKPEVGRRLALVAEKIAYQEKNIEESGPIYKSMKVEGSKVILSFNHIGSGLIAKDTSTLKQFAIAGADKRFVWAKATINGDKVIVESNAVQKPVAVRYAWADNPEGCNLYNKEGLPASPFRTDGD